MEMILIKPESAAWEEIWNWLAAHPINKGLDDPSVAKNPHNDEVWKYQGSYRGNDGIAVAEFIHRSHPSNNEQIPLTTFHINLKEEDIEKVIKIK